MMKTPQNRDSALFLGPRRAPRQHGARRLKKALREKTARGEGMLSLALVRGRALEAGNFNVAHDETLTRATALGQIQGFVHRETEELKTPPIALEVPPSPASPHSRCELITRPCCPSQPSSAPLPDRPVWQPTPTLPTSQTNDQGLDSSEAPHDMSSWQGMSSAPEDGQLRNDTFSVGAKGEDECLTMEEVAAAWMEAVSKINKASARAMCIPAVAIAAGSSYDTPSCARSFDSTAKGLDAAGKPAWGLWQISSEDYDPDPRKQAEAVYKRYTSDHKESGCLSSACRQTNCALAHVGIEQDETTVTHHVFCRGIWQADSSHYAERLTVIGEASVAEVCAREASLLDSLLQNTSVPFSEWAAATKQPGE